jgi:hypothetical protein
VQSKPNSKIFTSLEDILVFEKVVVDALKAKDLTKRAVRNLLNFEFAF